MNEYIGCLKNYVGFSGRARRREFWMFVLFNFIATLLTGMIDGVLGTGGLVNAIYSLAVLLPGFAVFMRRMHDTGRSGWWWLIGIIPFVGFIVLLVFLCQDSQPGENQYGPNPKGL